MRIATWNVNSLRPRLEHLTTWSATADVDVLCLQETKVVDDLFPHAEVEAAGWTHQAIWGQKTYNGVAILSRTPIENVRTGWSQRAPDPQARFIQGIVGGVRILNCYVPNGAPLGSDKFTYKLDWYEALLEELQQTASPEDPLLLCGDMNVAPDDPDVYDPFDAEGDILFSAPERKALDALCQWGLVDTYRAKNAFKAEYSWWDYRGSAFKNNLGFRIDHIFVTAALLARVKRVEIDREPRGWDRPSDHTPVIVTLND